MNTPQFSVSMIFAFAVLVHLPAGAQQGPAGVPGVLGIIEAVAPELTSPPPPAPAEHHAPVAAPAPVTPSAGAPSPPAKPIGASPAAQKKAKKGAIEDCNTAGDPARCRLYQKARQHCQALLGAPHRQCLRNALAPGK